ncbi:hypothetical protein AYO44_07875 [Planctomycetaceae bacterium SCGC AG-212-F19]|nr:hypothetical protein AYO44_07875 [Planctomycetaceae bacterium SCGC AG-212-F19]
MAALPFGTALRHVLHRIEPRPAGDHSDGALLARFTADGDETAFAALVARHGPMVLGVCRRLLGDQHDAEDAFQATFLILARKAAALDGRQPLGSWLYTVARNLALKHRARGARRRMREQEAGTMPKTGPQDETAWREVCTVLDTELGRLPEKYRAPLVLCHLQGMTHEAAARELGWPAGSMAKRLTRGQELLRQRLVGRGITLALPGLLALMAQKGSAAVPPPLAAGIGMAAPLFAGGKTTAGHVSVQAVALAGRALHSMTLTKLKIAAVGLLGLVTLGAGTAVCLRAGGNEASPLAAVDPSPARPAAPAAEAREVPPAADAAVAEHLRRKLDQPVNLDKGIDANTPLKDALEFLSDRYDLTLVVDEKAFEARGVQKVAEQPVSLPKLVGVRLSSVFRLLLGQIELDNGEVGGIRIKGDALHILPVVACEPDDRWLPHSWRRRLLRPVAWDKDIAAGTPFAAVLEQLTKQSGTSFAFDEKAFKALAVTKPGEFKIAQTKLAGQSVTLNYVLDSLMAELSNDQFSVHYRVQAEALAITAAKRDSAEERALWNALAVLRERGDVLRQIAASAKKLEKVVTLRKEVDAETPLRDALEFFSDEFDVTLVIDATAFAAIGIPKVEEERVQLPPQKEVQLGVLLRKLLEQVQHEDWTAGYIVREEYIEITPVHKNVHGQQRLSKGQLQGLWDMLAEKHWQRPVLASQTLARFPEQAVALLRERLPPAPPADPKKAAEASRWVKDLASDRFPAREKAAEELDKLGSAAVPALRAVLEAKPTLDLRTRVESLLAKLEVPMSRERARELWAVHLLEEIGTPEARAVLETLTKGARDAWTTDKAKAALERLNN